MLGSASYHNSRPPHRRSAEPHGFATCAEMASPGVNNRDGYNKPEIANTAKSVRPRNKDVVDKSKDDGSNPQGICEPGGGDYELPA